MLVRKCLQRHCRTPKKGVCWGRPTNRSLPDLAPTSVCLLFPAHCACSKRSRTALNQSLLEPASQATKRTRQPHESAPGSNAYMPAPPCTLRMFQCRHSLTALNQSLLGSASAATDGTGHLLRRITTASPGPSSVRSLPSKDAHTWPRASAGTCTHGSQNRYRIFGRLLQHELRLCSLPPHAFTPAGTTSLCCWKVACHCQTPQTTTNRTAYLDTQLHVVWEHQGPETQAVGADGGEQDARHLYRHREEAVQSSLSATSAAVQGV